MALYYIWSMPAALAARKLCVVARSSLFLVLKARLLTHQVQILILKNGFQNIQRL